MKIEKQKRLLESIVKKLTKAKDFGSDCVLTSDEALITHALLTATAVKLSKMDDM